MTVLRENDCVAKSADYNSTVLQIVIDCVANFLRPVHEVKLLGDVSVSFLQSLIIELEHLPSNFLTFFFFAVFSLHFSFLSQVAFSFFDTILDFFVGRGLVISGAHFNVINLKAVAVKSDIWTEMRLKNMLSLIDQGLHIEEIVGTKSVQHDLIATFHEAVCG